MAVSAPGFDTYHFGDTRRFRAVVEIASLAELPGLIGALHEALAVATLRLHASPTVATHPAHLVDAAALAAHLGIPVATVRDYARRRLIPATWLGRHLRFDVAAVIEALRDGAAPRRQARSRPVRRRSHRMHNTVGARTRSTGAGFSAPATGLLPSGGQTTP